MSVTTPVRAEPILSRLFLIVGAVTIVGPATMDMYLPGLPQLARSFHSSASSAQFTMTTYVLGLAAGQLVAGPLSDVYGRRRPLAISLVAYSVLCLACAAAPSIGALALLRAFQGMLAAAGMSIGRAVVRDRHSGAAAAHFLSRLMLIVGIGPILAPVVGAQILRFTSWRGTFVALAFLGVLLTVLVIALLPETLPPELRRGARPRETVAAFGELLRDGEFRGLTLVLGLSGGAFLGYLSGSAFALEDVYGASPQLYSALFAINGALIVATSQLNAHLLRRYSPARLLEAALALMTIGAIAFATIVAIGSGGIVAASIALTILAVGWPAIQSNATAIAMTGYPHAAGSASALLGALQFGFGAWLAPLAGLGSHTRATGLAAVALVCAALALLVKLTLVRRHERPTPDA